MPDQDIREARERVKALREQVRAEGSERAVASNEAAKEARLAALTEEERHLEAQLADLRSTQAPVGAEVPAEGSVNEQGEPVSAPIPVDEAPPEGGFTEEVDQQGNLVRRPLAATAEPAPDDGTE